MNEAAAALAETARKLEAVSDTPRLDAELLLAHALGMERGPMLLTLRDLAVPVEFEALIARRMKHEPIAYIIGYRSFWDLTLHITPDVLIPRSDSETLIEAAIGYFRQRRSPERILDLGTGSGALILAALSAFPQAKGIAIDASKAALKIAAGNADTLDFAQRTQFLYRNWHDYGWSDGLGEFDLILCNPPYVESGAQLAPQVRDYEPASALFAGYDGLEDYQALIPQTSALLTPGGVALFEIGKGQEIAVGSIAQSNGFSVEEHTDLGGIIRALSLSKSQ
ncbi:MAG: peptide chain release factor N(5)-glutamine methyltransferase [Sphingorhabdus sp.]